MTKAQQAQAAAGTTEDREFATEAQAPAAPSPTQDFEHFEVHGSFRDRLAAGRTALLASRGNTNLLEAVGEVLQVRHMTVTEMRGSKYADQQKVTFVCSDGRIYDGFGNAVVEPAQELLAALGPSTDWPEAIPLRIASIDTTWGTRPVIEPAW